MKPQFESEQSRIAVILGWAATWIVPVALALTAVRLVLNPWFVELEYRTPFFPDDPFGFTQSERLNYARIALEYLVNDAGIEFLGDLRFPVGQQAPRESCIYMDDCTRLYNDRELQHMLDVKIVVQAALRVWVAGLFILLAINILAWRRGWEPLFRAALARGGKLTLIVIAVILLAVFLFFDPFFVLFHRIFFRGDSWLFLYSDTLIRLFPERFWSDTFIMVGVITALLGIASALGFQPRRKRT